MQVINLTPHSITVIGGDGSKTSYPSAGSARVDGLPFGPVVGLPEPTEGTVYVVSIIVAEAAPERTDLCVPGEQVRDTDGRVVGCLGLLEPEMCSPALARERLGSATTGWMVVGRDAARVVPRVFARESRWGWWVRSSPVAAWDAVVQFETVFARDQGYPDPVLREEDYVWLEVASFGSSYVLRCTHV